MKVNTGKCGGIEGLYWKRYGVLDNTTCIYTISVTRACIICTAVRSMPFCSGPPDFSCTCLLGTKMEMESLLVSLEEAEEQQPLPPYPFT